MKQAIILTEFNQGLDMQFLNQSLGFFKEFEFKIKPIDSKEQELINLFNLKFGRFSWENYLA
ncbi:hypothetical protein ACOWK8_00895 [Helicobacter pylori]